ncbi:MAG: hypothetical protein V1490_02930 [Candidatus Omnitrophota bacterium]|nr:hypothetical protein [Candidatus Omnitrophota bacterium]
MFYGVLFWKVPHLLLFGDKMYFLLDSNVTAGYYLPRSLGSKKACKRIEMIFDSVRSRGSNHFFYIPNFCIAEVFGVFAKYCFGDWNPHVRSKGAIDPRLYVKLIKQFEKDIHNGKFLYHYELSRYHILAVDLVAPVDHYFRISRSIKKQAKPMGTFDHLIIAMGIHLAHIHTPEKICILSADDRLTAILRKCKSYIPRNTLKKLKLDIAAEITGKPFGPNIFPRVLNLKSAKDQELVDIFGGWPLEIRTHKKVYRYLKV